MEIRIRNLEKNHGTNSEPVLAIDDFTFQAGRRYGLYGANGAGKTSLLKILAGLDQNYTGEVVYSGDKLRPDAIRQKASLVFQKPFLLKRSLADNLAYGLKLKGLADGKIQGLVDQALQRAGLNHLADRKGPLLSAGEAQLGSLMRALLIEPAILLLDEPFAALDQGKKTLALDLLEQHWQRCQPTIIIVSHDSLPPAYEAISLKGGDLV